MNKVIFTLKGLVLLLIVPGIIKRVDDATADVPNKIFVVT